MTLQEAILVVLKENGGSASAKDIAIRINELNIYKKGDNTPLDQKQISARVKKYSHLFELKDGKVYHLEVSPKGRSYNYATFLFFNAQNIFHRTERGWYFVISSVYFYAAVSNKLKHASISKYSFRYDLDPASFKKCLLAFYQSYVSLDRNVPTNFIDVLNQIPERALEHLYTEIIQYEFDPEFIIHEKIGIDFNRFWVENIEFNSKMGEFSSPSVLRLFISRLISEKSFKVIYDPAVGIGNLLLETKAYDEAIYCQDTDPEIATIAYMNLTLNGFENVTIVCEDSITSPIVQKEKADLIITAPPFINDTIAFEGYPLVIEESSFSILNIFIQLVVSALSVNGIAIIHIPEGFLYSQKRADKLLREYLLAHDLLDSIISLPSGILWPYTGLKTSIMVLSKSKPTKSKGRVFVLDTESFLKPGKTTRQEFDGKVFELVQNREEVPLVSASVECSTLLSSTDINVKALTMDWNLLTVYANQEGKNFSELRDLVLSVSFPTVRENPKGYPFIKVSHLCGDLDDYPFELKELDNEFKFKSGKLVTEDVILVAKLGNDLKATAFHYDGTPIIVDNNVLVLVPDLHGKKITPTYLLFELHKEYISHQVKTINRGVTIPHRTTEDILSLKILNGDFDFQSKSIQEFKDSYKKLLSERHNTERKQWGFDNDDILPHLQHTYSQMFSSLKGQIAGLENFISSKINRKENIAWEDRISSRADALSLESSFLLMKSRIDEATNLVSTLKRAFSEGDAATEIINVNEVISSTFLEFQSESSNKNLFIVGQQNLSVNLDNEQFKLLLRNIFSNGLKHGFAPEQEGNFVFETKLSDDKKFLVIRFFNDGKPLKDGFTFEDFLKYGKRTNKDSGNGLGGYLIEKVVLNHNGIIREIPGELIPISVNEEKTIFSKFKFEILIPNLHE